MLSRFDSKIFRYFVPFMVLVVGGSFAIQEITEIRYKYRRTISYDDVKKATKAQGIEMKPSESLEKIYEDMKEKLDIDNWENIRIPRPWEEENNVENKSTK
ncbi:cytochrome c oxidase assembly protein COX16 homolog l(3)neo43 [Nomia melanderi]|uniref:cytochrome c oxidase assembly protein COX16 homolog l(3)neo43 n=1 Tax=Nomia melanderi TaxID=2448451 RepID=UPI001303FEDC|nr:cytochrome c oxidase assembly protein COX16 homolog, mitochondrial [Nomia melanderi]XP_031844028.1 cytochrome c oxidase assembly protein COX16 homolog, mitochondrial [Nomia melanderi]XP_031844029.1 cytochrome c oxidase assembly protein COX16 homolog, mitochondrial [Nomia melanderi]XP_031844030.1 cytochrome c oxidase assembly protein COX16 homolog, mitochondrial [Nomia melanderi]